MYLLLNLVTFVLFGLVPAALLCVLAGRWDLWNVWVYLGINVVLVAYSGLALYRKNPDLLKEQMRPAGRDLPGRRSLQFGFNLMAFLALSIAGLDQRFHWSDVIPLAGVVAGLLIVAIGWGLTTWSVWVNPFFSPAVRIQAERGQRVISEGPYSIVRHPGYIGITLASFGSGMALNSLLSIIPAVIYLVVTVGQTMFEDQMLRDELAGHADYAAKVRYRLIPGVW
jgi:protein-S-isoprenylcysteine O-methyltransferase Ste14